ncbi:MAG TPA: hypothetical protein OIL90_06950 [Phascolarctobacterium faecium]|uniref:hypothetical protein n=1 Tax=Phascolarctobacterium faecium TaxID=33025 RepID=UPI00242EE979|nr:hypothetical protein [Phascolarctobacterium faecium]HJI09839.1 hypothetical protein [Phascolarctobacterium faecium]
MVDIALHANDHDILIKDGDFLLIDNAERVAQQIKVKLLTFLGEWFLDNTWGVPYLEYILVKQPNQDLIKQILSEQISSVDDVKSLNALELDYQVKVRTLIINYEVSTEYGLITRKEVLGYGDK